MRDPQTRAVRLEDPAGVGEQTADDIHESWMSLSRPPGPIGRPAGTLKVRRYPIRSSCRSMPESCDFTGWGTRMCAPRFFPNGGRSPARAARRCYRAGSVS